MRILFAGSGEARLSGGMIMAILVGNALAELGHEVEYLTESEAGEWAEVRFPHRRGSIDRPADLRGAEAVITGFDGVRPALDAGVGVVAHFCAGYEPHLWPALRERFEEIYRLPSLKLVIAPHLQQTLRRELGVESVVVGAPVELASFAPSPARESPRPGPLRILTVGPEPEGPYAPVPFKGIADVLSIVRGLRAGGAELELVRLTPRADALVDAPEVDELHVGVPPARVPEIYRSCHVYLGASTAAEGLGMPALEAACAGLAPVLPRIPSFAEIPELEGGSLFYPPGDLAAATAAVGRLISEPELAGELAAAIPHGRLRERYSPLGVAERIAAALEEAAGARR